MQSIIQLDLEHSETESVNGDYGNVKTAFVTATKVRSEDKAKAISD